MPYWQQRQFGEVGRNQPLNMEGLLATGTNIGSVPSELPVPARNPRRKPDNNLGKNSHKSSQRTLRATFFRAYFFLFFSLPRRRPLSTMLRRSKLVPLS